MSATGSPVVAPAPDLPPHWRLGTRVAFRFAVVYFGLYVVCTQMIAGLAQTIHWNAPPLGQLPPMSTITMWVIRHVFRDTRAHLTLGGSGDKLFDWAQAFSLLVMAAIAAAAWSFVDRRTASPRLHRWFRVFLRFALGSTLISYGAIKVVPLQMAAPTLTRLLEPFGQFSPMGVLWQSIGASRPYEMFTGSVELLCGILLFVPRTQLLGAALALAATTQIFTLNMTYDVPVKLFSFHLVLMSAVLLAPDVPRLWRAVFFHRVGRLATLAQVAFGAYIVALALHGSAVAWRSPFAGGGPKPPLYGVWNVDRMTIDGVERPPLINDDARWRRVVVQFPKNIIFWHMSDAADSHAARIDMDSHTISLPERGGEDQFAFVQADADHLVLDGTLQGHRMHVETHLVDLRNFPLLTRGFHWVQEQPVNR